MTTLCKLQRDKPVTGPNLPLMWISPSQPQQGWLFHHQGGGSGAYLLPLVISNLDDSNFILPEASELPIRFLQLTHKASQLISSSTLCYLQGLEPNLRTAESLDFKMHHRHTRSHFLCLISENPAAICNLSYVIGPLTLTLT